MQKEAGYRVEAPTCSVVRNMASLEFCAEGDGVFDTEASQSIFLSFYCYHYYHLFLMEKNVK